MAILSYLVRVAILLSIQPRYNGDPTMLVSLAVAALLISPIAHNGNGIQEDDPRWDCTTMGNFICGRIEGHSVVSQSDAPGRITYTFDNGSTFTCNDWHNGQECTGIYEIDSRS